MARCSPLVRLVLLLLVVSSWGGAVNAESQPAQDPSSPAIQVGVITALTGPRASLGEDARRGVEFALETLGTSPECRIHAVLEDSKGEITTGVSAYRKLVGDGARILLTHNSNISLAIAPLVGGDDVLQLAISTTSAKYSIPNDNTFRVNGPLQQEAKLLADTLAARLPKGTSVGILTMQDEYPVSLEGFLLEELKRVGLRTERETFLPKETEFRSVITRFAGINVSAVLVLGYQTETGYFVRQFRELKTPIAHLFSIGPVNNPEFFQSAGPHAEGVVISYPSPDFAHPAAAAFEKRWGMPATFSSASAYDGIILAHRALAACKCQPDTPCLAKALTAIKHFEGMSGTKGFDDVYGDMTDTYLLMVARGGKFVPEEKVR